MAENITAQQSLTLKANKSSRSWCKKIATLAQIVKRKEIIGPFLCLKPYIPYSSKNTHVVSFLQNSLFLKDRALYIDRT